MRSPLSSAFSPHSVEPERLEQLLVGRDRLLSELLDDLVRTVRGGSGRYEALVGPRGIGKSHVMALLKHRAGLHDRLAGRVAIAWLGEEEHVNSLVALLARVLGALSSDSIDTSDQVVRLRRTPASDQEELAVSMLEQQTGDRALVLMVENLDDLLDALGRQAQQKLRNLLQSHPSWNIVATSCSWSAALANKGSPLYGSFVRRNLEPLTAEQCHSMLVQLAQVHGHDEFLAELRGSRGMPRIRAIHHVVGGAPRAMAQLYPHLQRRTLENLEAAFYGLAEELTPYFQEQMRRRPAGQRPVLEALAESWRPLSVGELAERTFNTHQTTSGYLRYLNQDRLVLRYGVGREAFYSLAEPLFRIARSMKQPDGLAEAFVRCVAGWFTEEEIEEGRGEWEDVEELLRRMRAISMDDTETEFDRACRERFAEAAPEACVDVAREWYERKPGPQAAGALLMALEFEPDHFRSTALELTSRHGGLVAWTGLLAVSTSPTLLDDTDKASLLARFLAEFSTTAGEENEEAQVLTLLVEACWRAGGAVLLDQITAWATANPACSPAELAAVLVEWKTCPTRRTLERLKELRRQPWSPRSTVRAAADLAWRFDTISASLEILGELASREEPLPIDVRRHVLVAEVGGPAGARRLDPKLDDETIGPETLNSLFDAQRAPACSLPDIGLSDASDTPFDDKQLRGLISLVFWIRTISAALADPDAWLPLLALPPTGALPSAALLEASRLLDTPLELAELAALLERLQALPEGPDDLAMPLALTQLPRTPRAFGRLAPPERALVRDAIRLHHGPESHWLTDLPPEPS